MKKPETTTRPNGTVRCAIYTRKSSEEGLEEEFNSLRAQREACEAFINSQRHQGWVCLSAAYDDGGFSGATLDRPALRQLLADVTAGRVDTVVVYKIDRLTRSLADFAKIVEILDARGASWQRWPRGDVERYPLQQMAQMFAAHEAVGNHQPPKGDWRSASVQVLIAQERQRSLLWRPQRFWVGARSTFGEDRAQRGSMSRTPRGYDVEQARRFSDTTIAYYDQFARAFWNGTRHHDVSQNYAAFLDAIEGDPPYSILDLGCGPGRDLIHFRSLGHEAVGLDGSQQFVAMARSHSQCEVLHQDFLAMQLRESRFDGIFANASLFHVPSQELQRVLLELFQTLKPRGVLFSSNPRGNNEEGFTDDRYACFFDLDTWRDYVTSAGFEEVRHYYRPPGLPRHKQPWLATIWRKA